MRNRVAHRYQSVDYVILWEALAVDLPHMSGQVAALLAELTQRMSEACRANHRQGAVDPRDDRACEVSREGRRLHRGLPSESSAPYLST